MWVHLGVHEDILAWTSYIRNITFPAHSRTNIHYTTFSHQYHSISAYEIYASTALSPLSLETNETHDMNDTPYPFNTSSHFDGGDTNTNDLSAQSTRRKTSSVFESLPLYPLSPSVESPGTKDWESAFLARFLRASISEEVPEPPLPSLPATRPKLDCQPRRFSSFDEASSTTSSPIERTDSVRAARSDSGVCMTASTPIEEKSMDEALQNPAFTCHLKDATVAVASITLESPIWRMGDEGKPRREGESIDYSIRKF